MVRVDFAFARYIKKLTFIRNQPLQTTGNQRLTSLNLELAGKEESRSQGRISEFSVLYSLGC